MTFPTVRCRRLRHAKWIRELVAENSVASTDLILPIFVCAGVAVSEPIPTMPSINRLSIDNAVKMVLEAYKSGIQLIALFPSVDNHLKDAGATESYNHNNIICRAISEIKALVPNIGVMADVALDPYTDHGHDGLVIDGKIANDETLEVLVKQAMALAHSGCDVIAPSEMMDGRVKLIRQELESNGFIDTIIMSYAVKCASAFYGPFRDAVKSNLTGKYLDKRSYHMDGRNGREAIKELLLDVREGADMLIIKPGMPYLDIVAKAVEHTNLPIVSYQVSGEYSMLKYAAIAGAIDFDNCMMESLISFKRAGASSIITYGALEMARLING